MSVLLSVLLCFSLFLIVSGPLCLSLYLGLSRMIIQVTLVYTLLASAAFLYIYADFYADRAGMAWMLFPSLSGLLSVTAGVFSVLRSNGHKKSVGRIYERH